MGHPAGATRGETRLQSSVSPSARLLSVRCSMRFARVLILLLPVAAWLALHAAPQSAVSSQTSAPPAAPASAAASPRTVDVEAMDRAADPCADFFQYACGGWTKSNAIPADQARWGRFNELLDRNQETLHQILEKAAGSGASASALDRKIGDYYASCMDEAAINAKGAAPLKAELERIGALKTKAELADTVARLYDLGVRPFFRFSSEQDAKDATQMIAGVDQGGLGLPDRDYYLRDDARSSGMREKYAAHVARMLQLAGDGAEQAQANAKAVLALETGLAKASMDRVARREPANVYHKMTKAEFTALTPSFGWDRFFAGLHA